MSNLGTYSTIDCPTKKVGEAFKFLRVEFEKIGGKVFQIMNPHDFGSYPSFEIDYPERLTNLDEDDSSEENLILLDELDVWHTKADEIEDKYNKKFETYL